jgi:hypothetical protein
MWNNWEVLAVADIATCKNQGALKTEVSSTEQE